MARRRGRLGFVYDSSRSLGLPVGRWVDQLPHQVTANILRIHVCVCARVCEFVYVAVSMCVCDSRPVMLTTVCLS